jgi:predicted Zn-dependent protease
MIQRHSSGRPGLVLLMLSALALTSCQTVQTTQPGAVGVEREQSMLLSSAQVDKSAAQAYQQEMKKAAGKNVLNRDSAQVARVRAIAQRLIPATAAFRPDAPRWAWETNVITSNDVNAWCMPGGKIAVYTGLIEKLKVTDDELAAVMGHEIAHALREHGRERASQAMAQSIALSIGGALLGLGDSSVQLAQIITDVTINLPNSREHEIEADRVGVELAARGGYDPRAAITLWQKMGQVGGAGPPQFLSTHPAPQNRQKDLTDYAARVMPLYEAARKR